MFVIPDAKIISPSPEIKIIRYNNPLKMFTNANTAKNTLRKRIAERAFISNVIYPFYKFSMTVTFSKRRVS